MSFEQITGSIERFANARGISPVQEKATNRLDRRVYLLGDRYIAKAFAPSARDRYERERTFLGLDVLPGRRPELVEADFDAEAGGLIVTTALSGRLVLEVHPELSGEEYSQLVADLGECMAAIHSVPLAKVTHVPATSMESERRRNFDLLADVADRLRGAHVLPGDSVPALLEAASKAKAAAFASPRRYLHGDVHNANVLASRGDGRWACALIDFEECAPGHVEMDFVFPFLTILGEAFPGRRLAASWERVWRSFTGAYSSIAGIEPELDLIIGHAIAWYLSAAVYGLDLGHPRHRYFARTALEALDVGGGTDFARHLELTSG